MSLENHYGKNDQEVEQKLLRNIMGVVADKRATYATEVSHLTEADRDQAAYILRKLEDAGVLEVLKPAMKNYDGRILSRKGEVPFNSLKAFDQARWYGLNSDYNWTLKVKDRDLYVDEYHIPVENSVEIDTNLAGFASKKLAELEDRKK